MSNPSDNNPDQFPEPEDIIPPGAPPELVTLATNINEMLQPIIRIRGSLYTKQLITMMTLFQQAAELEKIACSSTQMIAQYLPHYADVAEAKHETTHLLAEATHSALTRLVEFFESLPEFKGISNDLEIMLKRIKADWHDKQGDHS